MSDSAIGGERRGSLHWPFAASIAGLIRVSTPCAMAARPSHSSSRSYCRKLRRGGIAMRLEFLGSGDAFGSGGRFNTCFRLERAGGDVLIDCGASSLIAMRQRGVDPNAIALVVISHLHGDHFGGLP